MIQTIVSRFLWVCKHRRIYFCMRNNNFTFWMKKCRPATQAGKARRRNASRAARCDPGARRGRLFGNRAFACRVPGPRFAVRSAVSPPGDSSARPGPCAAAVKNNVNLTISRQLLCRFIASSMLPPTISSIASQQCSAVSRKVTSCSFENGVSTQSARS